MKILRIEVRFSSVIILDRNSAEKPKQILYKPPVPSKKDKAQEPSTEEHDGEGIDDIRARIAKQLEGFHKQKQLALAD